MVWGDRPAIAALLILACLTSSARARDLRLADAYPPGSPTVEAAEYMNRLVRERTQGRHNIEIGSADRDSENFTIASVRNGMLDMARVNLSGLNSQVRATIVPTLPYLFRSTSHVRRILDGPIGEEILASLSSAGLVGLCFQDMGVHSFYSRTKAIRRADDMRGLMVRVQPAAASVTVVRALGATPVAMPFDRIQAALQTSAIDAVDDNWMTYVTAGHFKLARRYALTKHSMAPGVLVVSKIVWEQLPSPDRAIIRAAAKESVARARASFDAAELEARRIAEQDGVEVIDDVDRKSLADVLVPLYPALLGDPRLLDMVKRIRADDEVAHKP
jgi:TRAP-type C4-dicarboxylate transport system substrate-binding protein